VSRLGGEVWCSCLDSCGFEIVEDVRVGMVAIGRVCFGRLGYLVLFVRGVWIEGVEDLKAEVKVVGDDSLTKLAKGFLGTAPKYWW